MRALVRYQAALLLRSYGWLPPFLAYVLLMVVGVTPGDPLLGSQAVGAAVLLPVSAWLVRAVLTAEPAASRACLAAAATAPRVQLAALLTALSAGLALALGGALGLLAVCGPVGDAGVPRTPAAAAVAAGLLASAVCVLLGVAVGALCNRPVLSRAQYGIPLALAAATLVLVAPSSPANAAVRGLVDAARTGRVGYAWGPLVLAGALLAVVAAVTGRLAGRRAE
ncbi:ABC transporter [Kitasatospora sp. NPDC057015]|uniref:ABC transporter n=1 Tax=Kitasatospora sp. NPDC057015 TaxID=3346001 RepID=UPI0036296483